MFVLLETKSVARIYPSTSAFILLLVPIFLIISLSVYPAIISGIQNKEMVIIADAVAQLHEINNQGDSSGYHANIPVSDMSSSSSSPTPTTAAPSSIASTGTANSNKKDFSTQAALSSLTARPTNNIINTNSFYDVVFLAATSGTIKKIEVTFPAGTTIPTGAFFNEAEGIGPGTASKSGQTITYTVTNAVNVPAGTKIRLEFASINNPLNPSASYQVTVTTRDAANAIIDGPTQSTAYTMKQIGVNAIANNAITTPKLADNAVTSAKIMKDVVHVVWSDSTPGNFDIFYKRDGAGFDPTMVNLSNNGGNSFEPAIAASGSNLHIAWNDVSPGNDEVLYRRSTDGGATFSSTVNLSNDAAGSFEPSITLLGNIVHAVWVDGSTADISFRRSTDGGVTFGSTINLSNNAGFSSSPAIVAFASNVFVVWQDSSSGDTEIFYRRSTDGGVTFGSTINVSNTIGSSVTPSIAVSGNNVYVVWVDSNNAILFTRSIDGGATFGSPSTLSTDASEGSESAVTALGNSVYVIWTDSSSIIAFRKSTDGGATFGSTVNLNNNAGTQGPKIDVSANNVYAIWYDFSQGNFEILLRKSADGGTNFGSTVNLSNDAGDSFEPAIAVS